MKRVRKLAAATAITLILTGCGSEFFDTDCSHQMDDLKDDMGPPAEVQQYDSGDYHSHTWWYWNRGFARTFVWGNDVGSCETSDYTFRAIR